MDALRELAAEDFRFDDRQRRSLVVGGVEEWLGSLQFLVDEANGNLELEVMATAGDRLALEQFRWQQIPGRAHFEIEGFRVIEVDSAGRLNTIVLFERDDARTAHAELFERYVSNGADGMPASAIELTSALNDHDPGRIRAVLPSDLVVDDHRRTGIGRLESAESWIESVAALYELSPDMRVDEIYQVQVASHGRVIVGRMWGTNTEGGDFESCFVRLLHHRGDRIASIDICETEDLDEALSRFEKLA